MAVSDDFMKLDIRAGTISDAKFLKRPASPPINRKWTLARSCV